MLIFWLDWVKGCMKRADNKTCDQCKYFTGAGDWNLCCTQKHPTPEEKAKLNQILDEMEV